VGDTGQRETGDADSWLRKRGRSTDFTGCVQIEKSGTLLFFLGGAWVPSGVNKRQDAAEDCTEFRQ